MEDRAHLARAFSGEEEGTPWPRRARDSVGRGPARESPARPRQGPGAVSAAGRGAAMRPWWRLRMGPLGYGALFWGLLCGPENILLGLLNSPCNKSWSVFSFF